MKGVIADCLGKMVVENFGKAKWQEALKQAGLNSNILFIPTAEIPDKDVLKVVESVCKVCGLTLERLADLFGEYWVCKYAPEIYPFYYKGVNSAKEFLKGVDKIHRRIPKSNPPRFEYEEKGNSLIMKYKSQRNLMPFLIGLIKGVGKYFKTPLRVKQIGKTEVEVIFG